MEVQAGSDMIKLTIQGDLPKLSLRVRRMPVNIRSAAYNWLNEMTTHIAGRAEANAPILTGDLRATTQPMPIVAKEGGEGLEGGVESPQHYALLMHELQVARGPVPAPPPGAASLGAEPGEKYGQGKGPGGTASQPVQPEGGPGGKFITRVFNYHYQRYLKDLGASLKRAVEDNKA